MMSVIEILIRFTLYSLTYALVGLTFSAFHQDHWLEPNLAVIVLGFLHSIVQLQLQFHEHLSFPVEDWILHFHRWWLRKHYPERHLIPLFSRPMIQTLFRTLKCLLQSLNLKLTISLTCNRKNLKMLKLR